MSEMKSERELFEKLPEIREIMNENGIYFMNHSGWYEARDFKDFEYEQYINGAWYAWQEQQAKIDELQARIDGALIEMKNQLGDEDFCDMQRPDYDAMLYALRNIKDILKGNKDEN